MQATAVTDSDGLATFEKVPYGAYYIQETKPLSGYVKDSTKTPITVDGTFKNPDAPLATLTNCPTELLVQKVDQNNVALSGAQFGLFNEKDELVMTAVSDAEGMVRFVGAAVGKYTIRELTAPDGYLMSRDEIHVTIDEGYTNSDTPLATVINREKKITCIKVDTSGTPMPGIAFSLYNASTMEKVETAVGNQDGVFTFSQFDFGDWIIRENAAPNGYCRMEDIRIHVGDTDALASSMIYLKENHVGSYAELESRIQDALDERKALKSNIRAAQARMEEISRQKKAILVYRRTKEVYAKYRESGWSPAFYREHKADIEAHKEAQAVYSAANGKIPTLAELSEEYNLLLSQKRETGEEMFRLSEELKNFRHIKSNMDTLLDDERYDADRHRHGELNKPEQYQSTDEKLR